MYKQVIKKRRLSSSSWLSTVPREFNNNIIHTALYLKYVIKNVIILCCKKLKTPKNDVLVRGINRWVTEQNIFKEPDAVISSHQANKAPCLMITMATRRLDSWKWMSVLEKLFFLFNWKTTIVSVCFYDKTFFSFLFLGIRFTRMFFRWLKF